MATLALPRDERIGLVLAVALHMAVLAALVFARHDAAPVRRPDPVSVTISDDVAPTSTAPHPAAQAPADVAPVLGEPAPPAPAPAPPAPPVPAPPQQVRAPDPQPPQPPITRVRTERRPVAQAPALPTPKQVAPSPPQKRSQKTARPAPPARPASTESRTAATTPPRHAGGSRIGADFLKGVPNASTEATRGAPAAAIGPAQRSALSSSIARQLKPNWTAPQGADAELLVTVLTFDLDANGRLTGKPRVISQQGITDANRAQAARHAEQAIRAVQLASPFELPAQYYAIWRHVAAFRFDRKLSQ